MIFLVDDESLLLDLAEATLQSEGYTLRKFLDPSQALRTFLRSKTKPALLITDYAMGKMNGLELITQCQHAFPTLKTILLSGSVGAEIVINSQVHVDHFISKPYQPASLSETVRSLLPPG